MAFPIPSHLPRKKDARDVSTQILTKISETTLKDLNASAASSWVSELEDTISLTKVRRYQCSLRGPTKLTPNRQAHIHERISNDLPDFERQLSTSISVQERLQSLSQNVNVLSENISNPQVSFPARIPPRGAPTECA